jgi:hypothetical protein
MLIVSRIIPPKIKEVNSLAAKVRIINVIVLRKSKRVKTFAVLVALNSNTPDSLIIRM